MAYILGALGGVLVLAACELAGRWIGKFIEGLRK